MNIKPPSYYFVLFSFLLLVGCAINPAEKPAEPTGVQTVPCYKDAAAQLLRWDKVKGKELKGLEKRRQAEMNLFLKGCTA